MYSSDFKLCIVFGFLTLSTILFVSVLVSALLVEFTFNVMLKQMSKLWLLHG